MSDFTIDPTQLLHGSPSDPVLIKLLGDLLGQSESFILHGEYTLIMNEKPVTVDLTHPLLKRTKEKKSETSRIEVLEQKKCSSGGFSKLFKSLGVLIPEQNYLFKSKPPEHSRVCKVISLTEKFTQAMVIRESSYTKMNTLLHCKTPVFDKTHGYLVMRNAGTSDLYELLNNSALSTLQKMQLTFAILEAIKNQVHELGLIHSDIKPENIMVDPDNMGVRIIDYAFAYEAELPRISSISGSLEFLAPETLYDNIKTQKSDSFAAGLSIAELWGDQSTFPITRDQSFQDVYEFHLTRTWKNLFVNDSLNDNMKKKIIKILDDLTRIDPDTRSSIDDALNEWEIILKDYIEEDAQQDTSPTPHQQRSPIHSTNKNLFFHVPHAPENSIDSDSEEHLQLCVSECSYRTWRSKTV
ncbi:protein kinase [uncultured Legionella sp.]|uniref:protein kinase domain-containing protein n=1 Tax=uncultured Legionella sp. TaxID=210934 RepID=UPI0026334D44|nr:protein kinase [uncultured Legionella sp.]